MILSSNIGALSFTHFWRGKAARITYSECVFVCYPSLNAHVPYL